MTLVLVHTEQVRNDVDWGEREGGLSDVKSAYRTDRLRGRDLSDIKF